MSPTNHPLPWHDDCTSLGGYIRKMPLPGALSNHGLQCHTQIIHIACRYQRMAASFIARQR